MAKKQDDKEMPDKDVDEDFPDPPPAPPEDPPLDPLPPVYKPVAGDIHDRVHGVERYITDFQLWLRAHLTRDPAPDPPK